MPSLVRKHVDLSEDNVTWFYDTYGNSNNRPSLSWLLDLLLQKFRDAHEMTPEELAIMGAEAMRKMMQEGPTGEV
ncbi:MAG TPA: hypothetical protein VF944_10875 [Candidatus Bathyarchaeia archaeon]